MKCSCLRSASLVVAALTLRMVDGMAVVHPLSDPKADAKAPESLGRVKASRTGDMPTGKKIAVVLRGETFRYGYADEHHGKHRKACAQEAQNVQMACSNSVIKQVIEPLERQGNTVEVFLTTLLAKRTRIPVLKKRGAAVTELVACPLDRQVFDAYNNASSRTVKWHDFETTGQADTMLKVVQSLNEEYGGVEQVGAKFDYIIFLRNDMHWFKPFDAIQADFDNVNVLHRCELGAGKSVGGASCVHDTFWMMPGSLYAAFESCLGKGPCFNPAIDPLGNGHGCQAPIRAALENAGHKDAFGWLSEDRLRVHKHSYIADLQTAR